MGFIYQITSFSVKFSLASCLLNLLKAQYVKKNNLDKHRKKLFKILYNLHKRCVLIDPINGKTLP